MSVKGRRIEKLLERSCFFPKPFQQGSSNVKKRAHISQGSTCVLVSSQSELQGHPRPLVCGVYHLFWNSRTKSSNPLCLLVLWKYRSCCALLTVQEWGDALSQAGGWQAGWSCLAAACGLGEILKGERYRGASLGKGKGKAKVPGVEEAQCYPLRSNSLLQQQALQLSVLFLIWCWPWAQTAGRKWMMQKQHNWGWKK